MKKHHALKGLNLEVEKGEIFGFVGPNGAGKTTLFRMMMGEEQPDAGSVTATNPNYTGSVLISGHSVGGSHGEVASKSLTFPTSGAVSRATS